MPNNLYRLNSISLNNFWCYNNEPNMFEMGESVTVIIGLNGAGKTAFLTAVKKAISFILSETEGHRNGRDRFLVTSVEDFRNGRVRRS